MQKTKKKGRPKKQTRDCKSFRISAYFTQAEFTELKQMSQIKQYKSLSSFLKDTIKIGLRGNKEIMRSIDNERHSYRSYAAALSYEIDNIVIQDQNLVIPLETKNSINIMIEIIDQFIARLDN